MSAVKATRFVNISLLQALQRALKSRPSLSIASIGLIAGINSVTPSSFAWIFYRLYRFCIHLFLNGTRSTISKASKWWRNLLTVYSCIEVFFYFYQAYLIKKAQRLTKPPPVSLQKVESLIERYFDVLIRSSEDHPSDAMAHFFERWSLSTPYDQICLDNIVDWLSFVFFGAERHEMNDDRSLKLKASLLRVFDKYNIKYQEGHNKNVHFMKPFLYRLDTVDGIWRRPWIYYAITDSVLSSVGHLALTKNMGYKFKTQGVLSYWVHNPSQPANDSLPPIVFFHGIGSGIFAYVPFLRNIHEKYSDRIIIVMSIRCVSMRFPTTDCSEIDCKENTLDTIRSILKVENVQNRECVFIGHSFGTMIVCWILNDGTFPMKRLIFIDPICFKLYEPDITFNFVYRKPQNVPQLFMWYFVCREFGIAYVIARRFWWFQNMVMLDKARMDPNPNMMKVFLSSDDCIIGIESVQKYLRAYGVEHFVAKHHVHGSFLLHRNSWDKVSEWI